MSDKDTRPAFPALYATIYRILVDVGREHGYAMGLHGSLARDLDVIAAPWTEEAAPAEVLVEAICAQLGAFTTNELRPDLMQLENRDPAPKPHGRMAWSLCLTAGAYIDLSVMPLRKRQPKWRKELRESKAANVPPTIYPTPRTP